MSHNLVCRPLLCMHLLFSNNVLCHQREILEVCKGTSAMARSNTEALAVPTTMSVMSKRILWKYMPSCSKENKVLTPACIAAPQSHRLHVHWNEAPPQ